MTREQNYESLTAVLMQFFHSADYRAGIQGLKDRVASDAAYLERWRMIQNGISQRVWGPEDALRAVQVHANQMLDEDTGEEAYRWLDLMVANVTGPSGDEKLY